MVEGSSSSDNVSGEIPYSPEVVREIFQNMRDFICLHTVTLDHDGEVTDCILQKWNITYTSVRKTAPEVGQSMMANYFTPSIALNHANDAWQNGSSTQLFEMNESMSDVHANRERVIRFGVRWQRIGKFILEVGTDLSTFDRLSAHENLDSALNARLAADQVFCNRLHRLGETDWAILDRLAEGYTDARIAETVFLNLQTVRNHVSRMLKTFDCENRTQLALMVVHHRHREMFDGK